MQDTRTSLENNCNCFKMSSYLMFLKCFKQLKQPTPEFCLIAYSGFLDGRCFLTCKPNIKT